MIDLKAYWRGRDVSYSMELTEEIRANAERTVEAVNELLVRSGHSDINLLNSGWRPRAVNESTANSGAKSTHISGQAADIPDSKRNLATWCVDNLDDLEEIGLWMEDPRWTPTWVHVQIVPPNSGRRVYIPNSSPPLSPEFHVTWA